MAKTVAHIIEDKAVRGGPGSAQAVLSTSSSSSVFEALEVMAAHNVGALVVLDGDRLVGILSERDYARKVILHDRGSRETTVSEIMTPEPVTVAPSTSVTECMELMTVRRFRHLPVMDADALIGVISIGDVVRAVIDEQQYMIEQLQGYITG
jgi:CBS domain-containing protein